MALIADFILKVIKYLACGSNEMRLKSNVVADAPGELRKLRDAIDQPFESPCLSAILLNKYVALVHCDSCFDQLVPDLND